MTHTPTMPVPGILAAPETDSLRDFLLSLKEGGRFLKSPFLKGPIGLQKEQLSAASRAPLAFRT